MSKIQGKTVSTILVDHDFCQTVKHDKNRRKDEPEFRLNNPKMDASDLYALKGLFLKETL